MLLREGRFERAREREKEKIGGLTEGRPLTSGEERSWRSLPLRWTRPTVVEDSRSKESHRVSKETSSTEAVQNITSQEKKRSEPDDEPKKAPPG